MEDSKAALRTGDYQTARILHAFLECDEEVQQVIRAMSKISAETEDAQERDMAIHTIVDALNPRLFQGQWGMDLAESETLGAEFSPEMDQAIQEMDLEEKIFAERLASIMEKKGLTQAELAAKIGVGQPAISNMLSRQCRPQKRTIQRLAEALNVKAEELWPT